MAIYASAGSGGSFTPAPQGVHQAVCVDVVDMGLMETTFQGVTKMQHKVRIVWQIEEAMEDGKPFLVQKRYTLSLHEKAQLRKDLESWRSRPFTDAELKRFDVETILGVNALLNVMHVSKDGKTYANVTAVMPIKKGMAAMRADRYVRVQDRPDAAVEPHEARATVAGHPFADVTDDDIPF